MNGQMAQHQGPSNAEQFKQSFREEAREILTELESATVLDVTAVQLLWAAAREAQRVGVEFGFKGQTPEAVRSALAEVGIEEFLVTASAG